MRVSLDRRRPLVRRPHRSRPRRPDARPALAARPRRPERRRQVDAAPPRSPGSRSRTRARSSARPPSLTVGYLPQEHDRRPGETLLGYLARRTGVAAAEAEVQRHSGRLEPGRVRRPRSSASWRSAAATSRRARERSAPSSACRSRSTRRRRRSRAARRPGRRSPRSCSRASTCSCSTSRRTTSTSTGSTAWSGSSTASPAASPSSRTTAPSSTGRSTAIAEIDPWTGTRARVRGRLERVRGGARARPRDSSTPPSSDAQERRREVEALLHARRNQARAGGGFLAHATGGSDRRGTHALDEGAPGGAGARADRARREAVRAVAAPALAGGGAAAGRPRRVARGRRRRARRLPARPGRPRPRSGRARRDHGPERQRQVDAARAAARRAAARRRDAAGRPLDRDRRRSTSAATAYDGDEPLLAAFTRPHRPRARRRAHAAREVQPRRRPRRAAVRDALAGRAHARRTSPS